MARNSLVRLLPLLVLMSAAPAAAQVPANVQVYAVKFLCGAVDTHAAPPYRAVEPGNYGTIVNVTNLSLANSTANLAQSARVVGLPPVALANVALQAGQVSTVDCGAIAQALSQAGFQADGRFVEGYVMISYYINQIDPAILSLDVTAAYSYSGLKADTGASLQVVHVEPRAMFQPE